MDIFRDVIVFIYVQFVVELCGLEKGDVRLPSRALHVFRLEGFVELLEVAANVCVVTCKNKGGK